MRSLSCQDMTSGPLGKQILLFSLPLICSNLLQVLFNLADLAVVGQFVGSEALGSVGSTTTLVTMFTGFLIGLGGGINVLAARFFGARDDKRFGQLLHTAAILSLGLGILLSILGVAFTRSILQLLQTKEDLLDGAALYLRIYLLGMPAMAIYNYGSAIMSALGDTRRPLRFLTIAGVLNVILNLFFVLVVRLAVAGVALASIISQYLSAVLILLALMHNDAPYALNKSQLRLHRESALEVIRLGHSGRTSKLHLRPGQPLYSGGRQRLLFHHGGGQLCRRQRRCADLRRDGRVLHGLRQLYGPELRRPQ